jgi:3-hydroxyacyl-CoA dehydrogenase/enoyl-CoA hydratase/3-hydroxybutyryl-CoA epimerase
MGATQRLPRLIGVRAALDLLLTGRQIDGRKSNALGLADDVVPQSVLVEAASEIALRLATNPTLRKHRHQGPRGAFSELLWSENPLGRELFFARAKRRLRKKTRGLYPAPERILDVVRVGLARGTEQGLLAEAYAFGELAVTPEARALLNLKLATEELKKDRGVDDPRLLPRPVTQVAVIGAGLMGVGISYVTTTQAQTPVLLKETDDAALGRGLARLQRLFDDTGGRGQTPAQVAPATDYSDLAAAGLVIEAVFEELELKRQVLRETEERTHPEAIFASNTSSIPISQIAAESKHPERVIGMHYFSPVHKMPLLEVIVTEQTAPWVTATAVAFGKKQGKTVIVVRDGAGFYSTRILTPYLQEAVRLLAEGVSVQSIDQALVDWGFPVGPLTLLDEVGVDVIDQVSGVLSQAFGARMPKPLALHALVSDRRLGRKSQRGFYLYPSAPKTSQRTSLVARFRSRFARRSGRPVDPDLYRLLAVEPTKRVPPGVIADRCALSMINEAAHCLGQGVVRRPRDADVGAVLGLGFPAFRGGPLRYVDSQGAVNIVKKLKRYAGEYGERFAPAPGLVEVAEKGVKFYP